MPKGWEFFLAKSESIWLRELYVDLRPVKFKVNKVYALKELTLSDCTFYPPKWYYNSVTPLKLKQFSAGQTSEYAIDQFDLMTRLGELEVLALHRNKKTKTQFLHKYGKSLDKLEKLHLDEQRGFSIFGNEDSDDDEDCYGYQSV